MNENNHWGRGPRARLELLYEEVLTMETGLYDEQVCAHLAIAASHVRLALQVVSDEEEARREREAGASWDAAQEQVQGL